MIEEHLRALILELNEVKSRLRVLEGQESSGGGADPDAIHDNVAGEINAVAVKAVPVNADVALIEDSADAWAKKSITLGTLPIPATVPDHDHTGDAGDGNTIDHGATTGRGDDDHAQYLLVAGTRAMTGDLNMGAQAITNVGNVDGVDVSDHSSRHDNGGADALATVPDHIHEGVAGDGGCLDHNDALTGLEGGDGTYYYHLGLVLYTAVQAMKSIGLDALATGEVSQLANIGLTTISAAQWGYLGVLNQNLRTTDSVNFDDLTLAGSVLGSTALGCRVRNSVAQTISTGTMTTLDFDTETADTDSCWASGANSDKLYARHAGYYMAGVCVTFDGNATGRRNVLVADDSGNILSSVTQDAMAAAVAKQLSVVAGMHYMAVDDYVQFKVWQNSGGNLNIRAATAANQHFCTAWLVRVA